MDEDVLSTFKILVIGESGVGKSSLLLRFVEDSFNPEQGYTIGVDFKVKRLTIDGNTVKLSIWDTAGQERFRAIAQSFYRDAVGAILVFDVNRHSSFDKLVVWLKDLELYSTKLNIVKMIVGNKIDMEDRQVSREEAMKFARQNQALYIETSAKTNHGVQSAFEELVHKIIQTPDLWETDYSNGIRVNDGHDAAESSCMGKCTLF